MFMNIKFNDVSLIKNYKLLFQENFLIHVNMNFEPGKIYLIKGDNSKYMIGKLLMNFIDPTFGTIEIDNFILKRGKFQRHIMDLRKKVAYLPYDYEEKFNYKLVNNIFKESLYNYDYNTYKDNELVEEIIDKTGCYLDYKKEKLKNLNSIQKYKLYLSSILIYKPDIIIVEKIINDDKINEYFKELAYKENKTIIFVGNYNMAVDKTYVINNAEVSEV